jgi:hypothetical protein
MMPHSASGLLKKWFCDVVAARGQDEKSDYDGSPAWEWMFDREPVG